MGPSPPSSAAVVAAISMVVMALCVPGAASAAGGPHMADLSVLLPPRMTKPIEYRLIGGDGCFSWYAR
jgi:nuclear pore complex protein Nup210